MLGNDFYEKLRHKHAKINNYCKVCLKEDVPLYHCEQCLEAVYCGLKCQKQDLNKHLKYKCEPIGEFIDELPPSVLAVRALRATSVCVVVFPRVQGDEGAVRRSAES